MKSKDKEHQNQKPENLDFAVFSVSLSFGIDPSSVDAIFPFGIQSYFNECAVSPRIRVSSDRMRLSQLMEVGRQVPGYDLSELLLVKYAILYRKNRPPVPSIALTETCNLEIVRLLSRDYGAELLKQIKESSDIEVGAHEIVAYNATAVIFVDDIEKIAHALGERVGKRGQTASGQPFLITALGTHLMVKGVRHETVRQDLSTVMYIIQDSDYVKWARGELGLEAPLSEELVNEISSAEERLSLIFETELLGRLWVWLRGQSIDVLNRMPKGLRDGSLQDFMDLTESLGVLRTTHIQATDFLSFRNDRFFSGLIDQPLSYGNPKMNFAKLRELIEGVDSQLNLLENTIQTRLSLKALATEQTREEQESRREATFNAITILLSVLIIFEIVADYLSWYFESIYPLAHVFWLMLGVCVVVVVYSAWRKVNPKK